MNLNDKTKYFWSLYLLNKLLKNKLITEKEFKEIDLRNKKSFNIQVPPT